MWHGFEAAHVFPLAYEQQWLANNYSRWITLPPSRGWGVTINSVRNGLLLDASLHALFDRYIFSINPDARELSFLGNISFSLTLSKDGHKIICFQPDARNISGTYLDARLLSNPQRPVDELFRWHFRQAVLTNMRGAGEPYFEHDFPPGLGHHGGHPRRPESSREDGI